MPKSEAYFLWKHEKNPFGKSKVLLAKEGAKIIGLRAFMHWRWASKQKTITAVRAVDTATDPIFQGKGIFKKLTMQAVEECKAEGIGMVFNSPNPISMQGYLKMGWSIAGKMPLYFGMGSLVPRFFAEKDVDILYAPYAADAAIKLLDKDWALPVSPFFLHTPIDYNYINWRYKECPVVKYGALIEPGKFGFIFRLKQRNRFIELRICEAWVEPGSSAHSTANTALKIIIKRIRPAVISCAPSPLFSYDGKKIKGLWGPFLKGPVTTIRHLNLNDLENFTHFNQWQPSIGSMELF